MIEDSVHSLDQCQLRSLFGVDDLQEEDVVSHLEDDPISWDPSEAIGKVLVLALQYFKEFGYGEATELFVALAQYQLVDVLSHPPPSTEADDLFAAGFHQPCPHLLAMDLEAEEHILVTHFVGQVLVQGINSDQLCLLVPQSKSC